MYIFQFLRVYILIFILINIIINKYYYKLYLKLNQFLFIIGEKKYIIILYKIKLMLIIILEILFNFKIPKKI